jgi:hypothetical protein
MIVGDTRHYSINEKESNMLHRFAKVTAVFAVLIVLASGASVFCQETIKTDEVGYRRSTLVEKVKGGTIDWGSEYITATGDGRVPAAWEEPNAAKAYLRAKSYARMDAIKNLFMAISGAPVDYEGTGKDYMAQDETLRQTIKGYVRNVVVLREETIPIRDQEIIRITVGTKMYGKEAPGTALLNDAEQKDVVERDVDEMMPAIKIDLQNHTPVAAPPVQLSDQNPPFTSLIIDTRGFKVARCMSPHIRRQNGSEVWGTLSVSPDFAIETGIVSYVPDMETAMKSNRCGSNPLIVKAIGRGGCAAMCDPVVSDADAKRIAAENANDRFADRCDVIFIVDR